MKTYSEDGIQTVAAILAERDCTSKREEAQRLRDFFEEFDSEENGFNDMEDQFMEEFGLEPDYLFEVLL